MNTVLKFIIIPIVVIIITTGFIYYLPTCQTMPSDINDTINFIFLIFDYFSDLIRFDILIRNLSIMIGLELIVFRFRLVNWFYEKIKLN
jgi:hypothetical protein